MFVVVKGSDILLRKLVATALAGLYCCLSLRAKSSVVGLSVLGVCSIE